MLRMIGAAIVRAVLGSGTPSQTVAQDCLTVRQKNELLAAAMFENSAATSKPAQATPPFFIVCRSTGLN